jgi:hypothetical protein
MNEDIFQGHGIEVTLSDETSFLKIRETLQRIGVASRKDRKLFQSCHILHKQGRYAIMHFKEMFALDGKESDFSEEDKGRRNTIVALLEDWELCKAVDEKAIVSPRAEMTNIKVLSFKEKHDWELCPKYNIGRVKPNGKSEA